MAPRQRRFRIFDKGASVSLCTSMPASTWAVRRETFCELNRKALRRISSPRRKRLDATGAILSAQYDGLDGEVQLTCGGLERCLLRRSTDH